MKKTTMKGMRHLGLAFEARGKVQIVTLQDGLSNNYDRS